MIEPDHKTQLSKAISHALRHEPASYGLILDETVRSRSAIWSWRCATREEFGEVDEFDIIRQALRPSRSACRMRQGASGRYTATPSSRSGRWRPRKSAVHPVSRHVAGTLAAILGRGLLPMARQYVHLSADLETAHALSAAERPRSLRSSRFRRGWPNSPARGSSAPSRQDLARRKGRAQIPAAAGLADPVAELT